MINSASDYRTTRGGAENYVVSGQAMDTRESMMQQVYQTGFAVVDAQLFHVPGCGQRFHRSVWPAGCTGQQRYHILVLDQ